MKMLPVQHDIGWSDQVRTPEQMIELFIGAGKDSEVPLSPMEAFQILEKARVELSRYDHHTTAVEMKTIQIYGVFADLPPEQQKSLLASVERAAHEKKRQFKRAIAIFDFCENSEAWQPHLSLLRSRREQLLMVYGRASAFASSVFLELINELQGKRRFSYDLGKMKLAVENDFSVVPASVKSFEDFDKWMMES